MANEVKITVGADTKKADQAVKGFKKRLGELAGTSRKLGLGFSAMGAGGLVMIKKFVEAAIEQQQAESVLRVSLKNVGESWDELTGRINATTAATQAKTNFADEEMMIALGSLTTMLGSYAAAEAALPSLLDLTTKQQKPLISVTREYGKVLSGQTDILNEVNGRIEKTWPLMQKLAFVNEQVGGQAEAAFDPIKNMNDAWSDFSQTIGKALLPMIKPVTEFITTMALRLQQVNPRIVRFAAVFLAVGTALGLVLGPIFLLIGSIPILIGAFAAMLPVLLPVIIAIAGVALQLGLMILIWKNWNKIMEKVGDVWDRVTGKIKELFDRRLEWITPGGVLDRALVFIHDKWGSIWGAIRRFLWRVVGDIEDKINMMVNGAIFGLNLLIKGINKLGGIFGKQISEIDEFEFTFSKAFEAIKSTVVTVASVVKDKTVDMWEGIKNAVKNTTEQIKKDAKETFGTDLPDELDVSIGKAGELNTALAKAGKTTRFLVSGGQAPGVFKHTEGAMAAEFKGIPTLGVNAQRILLQGIGVETNPDQKKWRFNSFLKFVGGVGGIHPDLRGLASSVSSGMLDAGGMNFAQGGRVPGPEGSPQLAVVHGGEMILNRKQQQQAGIVVNITGNHITGEMELDRLVRRAITSAGVRGAF